MDRIVKETKFVDTILNVPISSQYLDIDEKIHLLTACGMTSVYMGLKFYGTEGISLDEVVKKGVEEHGFSKSGWIHDYLVKVFQDHGYECYRKEGMRDRDVEEIRKAIQAGNPVIISTQRMMFDRRIFHMVIVTGIRENGAGELEGFFYHDPAGLRLEEVTNLFVSVPVFLQYWRRMAIFPSRKSS
jgi:uncharacterized protein YvpB